MTPDPTKDTLLEEILNGFDKMFDEAAPDVGVEAVYATKEELKLFLTQAIQQTRKEERTRIEQKMADTIDVQDPKVHTAINKVYEIIRTLK